MPSPSSMPSGRGAATPGPAHKALAPGINNALTVGYMPKSPMNRLTGQALPIPPRMAPATPSASLPVAVAASPPKGQVFSLAIAKVLGADQLPPAEIKARIDRLEFVRNALGNLLKKSDITHEDCVDMVQSTIKARVVPASEAGEILGSLPKNPADLRAQLEYRRKVAIHALILLHGEQQARKPA